MKKQLFTLFFIGTLALVGAGCGDDDTTESKNTNQSSSVVENSNTAVKNENTIVSEEDEDTEEEKNVNNVNEEENENSNTANTNEETGNEEAALTLEKVANHATAEDCWMVVNGMIYDVTEYISSHPGGEVIMNGCGTDATTFFESRPESGTPHSESARSTLSEYEIGALEE